MTATFPDEFIATLWPKKFLVSKSFGFKRGRDLGSSKKYADLVRRALRKGLISRIEVKIKDIKSRYYYFVA